MSLVGVTEREMGVGKLGRHGNSTRDLIEELFILFCIFPIFYILLLNERKKKEKLTILG